MKDKIIAKQDELIEHYKMFYDSIHSPQVIALNEDLWNQHCIQLESELSSLKAEAEKEVSNEGDEFIEGLLSKIDKQIKKVKSLPSEKDVEDENDFVQYVTNLLYNAYADGKQRVRPDVFDEWIEKEMENMSEFYASHNLLAGKVSDEIIKPTADIDSIMRWLNDGNIKGDFDYVSLTPRYIAGLIQSFIAQWVLPIPKTVEFPNDTYQLSVTETCNKVITEIDKCECGHIAPLGFIHWNQDGDSTCVNCVNDILIDRLNKKNKQIKRLKDKAHRDNLIKKG